MKKIVPFIFLLGFSVITFGQDIHWSQFNDNPVFQNPANTGHFNGDIRYIGNYRDQWRSVTKAFSTLSASVDTKLLKHKQFGFGGLLFHDVVGDGQFRTIELQFNAAYTLKLTSDSTHSIRPGVNVGLNHRQLNTDQFYFDNQFDGIQFNPGASSNEIFQTDRKSNLSVGTGIIYEYYRNKRFNITGGMSFFNLNKPNQGFFNTEVKRDIRFNFFAKGIYKIGFDWDILPAIQLNLQGTYREFLIGSRAKYTVIDRLGEYRAFYGGLFYRNQDAMFLSLGMDYQQWFFGLSYDVNFSKLVPASHARGGFEIAVRYIMYRFKPKKIVHRICPDYI